MGCGRNMTTVGKIKFFYKTRDFELATNELLKLQVVIVDNNTTSVKDGFKVAGCGLWNKYR